MNYKAQEDTFFHQEIGDRPTQKSSLFGTEDFGPINKVAEGPSNVQNYSSSASVKGSTTVLSQTESVRNVNLTVFEKYT